jgi:ABC-type polysaccharide transport system permease subunit
MLLGAPFISYFDNRVDTFMGITYADFFAVLFFIALFVCTVLAIRFVAKTSLKDFILGVGGILNAGFEQQLLIGTESTRAYWEVIDTYVYRYGMQLGNYTFGTAVGLMKSIFGFSLVCFTNWLSGKVLDTRIF